jgi:hypothetical protein
MSKALKIAAVVVGVVAITVATAGIGTAPALSAASTTLAIGGTAFTTAGFAVAATGASLFGIAAGTLLAVSSALSLASGLTAKKPSVAATGAQTQFKADPNAGIPCVLGRTGEGGFIVFRSNADGWSDKTPNDLDDFVIVHSIGPIQGYEGFKADQVAVSFDGSGNGSGGFSGFMWQKSQLGATPEASALAVAAGVSARPSGWGTDAKLSGLAASQWRLRFDAKGGHYQGGTPKPQWVLLGVKVYDPRLDSTYPGGSGACRAADETTWVYSENPYLHALTWLIGRRQNGQRVMGVGMPVNGILTAHYVEGANIADANGWKVGGVVYSTDNKWEVLKAILQAGGGEPLRLGAQVGCLVNTPRVSLATITIDDLAQGEVSVTATQRQRDRINGVIPRYRSEDHEWEIVPGAPVRVASHVTEDGDQRTREIEYALVQVAAGETVVQPAQLARYDIENAREFGPISVPLKLRWMGYRPGDCVTANLPESGLNSQPILILNRALEPGTCVVTLTARSETPAKHPFALGQTTEAPSTPSVSGPPLVPTPDFADWSITGTSISSGGVTVPALVIAGGAPTSIGSVIFEYRVYTGAGMDPDAGWIAAGVDIPATTSKIVASVKSGETYQVSVSYLARGVRGGRLILGPVTTSAFAGTTGATGATGPAGPTGATGPQGVPGPPGADGSPTYIWLAYADSADGTTNFTNGSPGSRTYIGLAPNKTTATESSVPSDYSWSLIKGANGTDGVPGPPGADGSPTYIWLAYADSADGTTNFTNGAPGSRTYIGIAPNKTTGTESSTPSDYAWSLIKGADGAPGSPGATGPEGPQGPPGDPGTPGTPAVPPVYGVNGVATVLLDPGQSVTASWSYSANWTSGSGAIQGRVAVGGGGSGNIAVGDSLTLSSTEPNETDGRDATYTNSTGIRQSFTFTFQVTGTVGRSYDAPLTWMTVV